MAPLHLGQQNRVEFGAEGHKIDFLIIIPPPAGNRKRKNLIAMLPKQFPRHGLIYPPKVVRPGRPNPLQDNGRIPQLEIGPIRKDILEPEPEELVGDPVVPPPAFCRLLLGNGHFAFNDFQIPQDAKILIGGRLRIPVALTISESFLFPWAIAWRSAK